MSYYSRVIGAGSGFPQKEMRNSEFEKFLDTTDEWIRTRTGIETRRIADRSLGETTLSLARLASDAALKKANLKGEDLDLIVVGTVTPDTVMPTTANSLQAQLGAKKAFSFDMQAACSGFLYSLTVADQFIRNGTIRTALVIGAETLSTITNWTDRSTCILFGDGAGAVVLERTEDPSHRILSTKLFSDGTKSEMLKITHGYGAIPPYVAEYRSEDHKIKMHGAEVYKLAVRNMVDAATQVLDENNVTPEEVDFFIFHQANIRIIETCAKALKVDPKKMWLNVSKYGNTSAATLPICLDEAWRAGAVREGNLILLATFGGGLTWGSGLIRL